MVCSALEALESLQNTKIHLQITETDLLKSHSIDISLFKELRSAQPFPCIYSDEVFAPYASKYAYTASLIADAAGLLAVAGVVQHGQVVASPPTDMVDVHRVPFRSAWA